MQRLPAAAAVGGRRRAGGGVGRPGRAAAGRNGMKIFLDHDGGVDDFIAQIILCTDPESELVGISVIDADCFVDTAYDVSCRLLSLLNCSKVPIAKSTLKGLNPFPTSWRRHCESCIDFPSLNIQRITDAEANRVHLSTSGEQLLLDVVKASPEPVTIVVTGPMTNIAWALDKDPEFHLNVKDVVVMGGAIDVNGNVVDELNHDGSAEWNVYYDAPSFHRTINSPLRIILFPLDATNTVPISRDFVRRFGGQNEFLASQFVGNAYAMCSFDYFAWDALTAAFAVRPQLCSLEEIPITVVLDCPQARIRTRRLPRSCSRSSRYRSQSSLECCTPPSSFRAKINMPMQTDMAAAAAAAGLRQEGRTKRDTAAGRTVLVARDVDAAAFYDLLLARCRAAQWDSPAAPAAR